MVNLNITLIGSLPLLNLEVAVEHALLYDVPAVPELTYLDGEMVEHLRNPGVLRSLKLFKAEVKKRGIKNVKIQGPGPVTAIFGGYSADDAVARVCAHLEGLGDDIGAEKLYVFLDEPAIGKEDVPYNYLALWERVYTRLSLPSSVVVRGVHDCNDITGRLAGFFNSGIDVLSFDATKCDIFGGSLHVMEAYEAYRKKGGKICWGIIDARPKSNAVRLDVLSCAADGDLLSSTCGLGKLEKNNIYSCRRIASYLSRIKQVFLAK